VKAPARVSCPDWQALAAHRLEREARHAAEPEGWREALEHFDSCRSCRREAIAADPTLVFRRLAAPAPPAPMTVSRDLDDAEAMRQAVAAMRAARRVEPAERRPGAFSGWRRWAAAAVLTAASLIAPSDKGGPVGRQADAAREEIFAMPETAMTQAAMARTARESAGLPTVEGVSRPGARVYHMNGEGMSVVMVVDESLDI